MTDIEIRHVSRFVDQPVSLGGWVYHFRSSGKIVFIELRDGTGIIQCVIVKDDVGEITFNDAKNLTRESSVRMEGVIRRDERAKGGYEVSVTNLKIFHIPNEEYPISPKEHGVAFLMNNRHLWFRSSRQVAVLRMRASLVAEIRSFFDNKGFTLFDTPILTPAACEGTTTLFETDFFDDKAYLAQSGQLYDEAGAMALGKVYSFGPTFRAEKSKTRRHLSEFWMVEPEAAFYDLNMMMELAEEFVATILSAIITKHGEEFEQLERDIAPLKKCVAPFACITYDDAVDILIDKQGAFEWGDDFGGDEETIISQEFDKPVIIHRYPYHIKPFYMKKDTENPDYALNFDMIAPEGYGEIIGGGQREDSADELANNMKQHDIEPSSMQWYLDLRKYGSVPHAGFGLGLERTLAWICGLKHVRETIPFPRLMDRIDM